MRKSKKRVIAIITCCFVLCTFCIGVFADYDTDRVGTVLYTEPYDIGELAFNVSDSPQSLIDHEVYIFKYTINTDYSDVEYLVIMDSQYSMVYVDNGKLVVRYSWSEYALYSDYVPVGTTFYVYSQFNADTIEYTSANTNGTYVSCSVYSISAGTDINQSIYSNSQDVKTSIVGVINEATNVITTNNVIMMFCILIPVISFGAGILIRLRKRT